MQTATSQQNLVGGLASLNQTATKKAYYAPTVKYKVERFSNSARNDDFPLFSWHNSALPVTQFQGYTQELDLIQYTNDEYNLLLNDSSWSRRETDHLFHCCKLYNLRFIVIHDRYSFDSKTRSIDELKDRYYTVVKRVLTSRANRDSSLKVDLSLYDFNISSELERKRNLDLLFSRSLDQQKEEEGLYFELRKREVNEKKWNQERESILMFVESQDISKDSPIKKKKSRNDVKRKRDSIRQDSASIDIEPIKKEKTLGNVYLRSLKVSFVKANVAPKHTATLQELGFPLGKPKMPTLKTVSKFDELRINIVNLLELKRLVDRVDMELKVLLARQSVGEDERILTRRSSSNADKIKEKRRSFRK